MYKSLCMLKLMYGLLIFHAVCGQRDRLVPEPSIREWCEGYSVPSHLAKAKITANSFSIRFVRFIGNVGRISFRDKSYADQISLESRCKVSFLLQSTPTMLPSPIHYLPLWSKMKIRTAYGVHVTGLLKATLNGWSSPFCTVRHCSSSTYLKSQSNNEYEASQEDI